MQSIRYSCQILKKLEISTDFLKIAQLSSLIKIRSVGAELCHADGRKDMTKLTVAFRNFANVPNRCCIIYCATLLFKFCLDDVIVTRKIELTNKLLK
jgi:hypothetical protein